MLIECKVVVIRLTLKKWEQDSGSDSAQLKLKNEQVEKRQVAEISHGIFPTIVPEFL